MQADPSGKMDRVRRKPPLYVPLAFPRYTVHEWRAKCLSEVQDALLHAFLNWDDLTMEELRDTTN